MIDSILYGFIDVLNIGSMNKRSKFFKVKILLMCLKKHQGPRIVIGQQGLPKKMRTII